MARYTGCPGAIRFGTIRPVQFDEPEPPLPAWQRPLDVLADLLFAIRLDRLLPKPQRRRLQLRLLLRAADMREELK